MLRLPGAEVHEVGHRRVEDRPFGPDEPAAEVLEEQGAGGRQTPERAGVEDPAGAQFHPPAGRVLGRHPGRPVRQRGHRADGGLQTPQSRPVLQVPVHQRLEVVRTDHLVAGRRDVPQDLRPVPAAYPQPLPGGRRRGVVAPGARLPEAPGPLRRAQRPGRRIDQDHGRVRAVRRVRRKPVRQGQPRGTRAHDDDVRVHHRPPPSRPSPVRSPAPGERRARAPASRRAHPRRRRTTRMRRSPPGSGGVFRPRAVRGCAAR